MNRPLLILALLAASLRAAPFAADPFAPDAPSWHDEVAAAKPLTLEVCAGDVDVASMPADPASLVTPEFLARLVTSEFLASAKRLRIAVAPTDQGVVEAPDRTGLTYRLASESGNHKLEFLLTLRDPEAGLRQVNTQIVLPPGQWVAMGGLTRETVTTVDGVEKSTKRNLLIAVRLSSSAPAP